MIDLRPDQLAIVQGILQAEIPWAAVGCFGSRARWTSRDTSDLDLVIRSSEPLPIQRIGSLKSLFEASNLPFHVDLVDWHRIDSDFRAAIKEEVVPVMPPRNDEPGRWSIPSWRGVLLSECAEILSGGTPARSRPELWQGDIPWVSPEDLKHLWLTETIEKVTPAALSNGTRLVPAGTILILAQGPALRHGLPFALTRYEMAFGPNLKALLPRPGIDPEFLMYSLLGNKLPLRTLVDTSLQRLQTTFLKGFPIALPPLEEQRRIAGVLRTIDSKIELHGKINRTLQSMEKIFHGASPRRKSLPTSSVSIPRFTNLSSSHPVEVSEVPEEGVAQWLPWKIQQNNKQCKTLNQLRGTLLPRLISGEIRIPGPLDVAAAPA